MRKAEGSSPFIRFLFELFSTLVDSGPRDILVPAAVWIHLCVRANPLAVWVTRWLPPGRALAPASLREAGQSGCMSTYRRVAYARSRGVKICLTAR